MLKKTLYAATVAVTLGALALPAAARDYHDYRDDRAAGAFIGGIAGAAIGNQVDPYGGAIVGGILGALAGASIAGSSHYDYPRHSGYNGYGGHYGHSGYRGAYYGRQGGNYDRQGSYRSQNRDGYSGGRYDRDYGRGSYRGSSAWLDARRGDGG